MTNKKIIAFDLDGTLTESKSDISIEMYDLLLDLTIYCDGIAVISGASWMQFKRQLLKFEDPDPTEDYQQLRKWICLPTSGTSMYRYAYAPVQDYGDWDYGDWDCKYQESLTPLETADILKALYMTIHEAGGEFCDEVYGNQIEHRGSQITFSALGQEAPIAKKKTWDLDNKKREELIFDLSLALPEYHIRYGGTTSIDITRKGMDKSYGIKKICQVCDCNIDDILFVGDSLEAPGNDYTVKKLGVNCIGTSGPDQTKEIIQKLIKDYTNGS